MKIEKSNSMGTIDNKTQPELLIELIESLKQAAGAASQLIHCHSGNPMFWMAARDFLDLAVDGVMSLAPRGLRYAEPTKPRLII